MIFTSIRNPPLLVSETHNGGLRHAQRTEEYLALAILRGFLPLGKSALRH